mgnify:CR=1 FL=1
MRLFQWALDGLLFSGTYTACVAVGASVCTSLLLKTSIQPYLLLFTFCGTLVSYNLHWWLSPAAFLSARGRAWSRIHRNKRPVVIAISALIAVFAFTKLSGPCMVVSLVAAGATLLYSLPKVPLPQTVWLRKMARGKTLYLTAVWTLVTVVLPMVAAHAYDKEAFLLLAHRFFFIYALCLLFDLRDREQDRQEGISSLATHLPQQVHRIVFLGLAACSALPLPFMSATSGTGLAGLILSLFALIILYKSARATRSDVFYYLLLDGLMAAPVVTYGIKAAFH